MLDLSKVLADMDVPDQRRNLSNPANVRWLLRNLGIRNAKHPDFAAAIIALKQLAKRQ